MIVFLLLIAMGNGTGGRPASVCYHLQFRGALEMNRLLTIGCAVAIAAGTAMAANLAGKVSFLSKRGQNPNAAETLVWLDPASGHAPHRPAATFQMVTRNKMLVPPVLAGSRRSTPALPHHRPHP